jgi:peptidoglycan/xylan/chitin deacetylase (PgdA/CDA1 family)
MKKYRNLCLNYHDFSGTRAETSELSKYTVKFSIFKEQLDMLKQFSNVPLLDLLQDQKKSEFNYCLTFDDGFKSNLYIAEELAKRNLKGTFFIIKDQSLSSPKYLNKQEIKEVDQLGMEIGSHSCTHRHMNRLKKAVMIQELRESKIFLEDLLGKPIYSMAYPGGHFGAREIKASLEEGYLINRTVITGLNTYPLSKGIVKSNNITDLINLETFKSIISLSPLFFARIKIREHLLSFPKYVESKIMSAKF